MLFKKQSVYKNLLKDVEIPQWEKCNSESEFIRQMDQIMIQIYDNRVNFKWPVHGKFINIYRARKIDSKMDVNNPNHYGSPPVLETKFGRCNFPNKPVFYGGNQPLTALEEIQANDKDFYTISVFRIKTPKKYLIESFIGENLNDVSAFQIYQNEYNKKLYRLVEKEKMGDKKHIQNVLNTLHDAFINDSNYSVSSYLANRTLNCEVLPTDILIYPSNKTNRCAVNFAIRKEFEKSSMKLNRSYILKYPGWDKVEGTVKLSFHKVGHWQNDKVIWFDVTSKEFEEYKNQDFNL